MDQPKLCSLDFQKGGEVNYFYSNYKYASHYFQIILVIFIHPIFHLFEHICCRGKNHQMENCGIRSASTCLFAAYSETFLKFHPLFQKKRACFYATEAFVAKWRRPLKNTPEILFR